MPIDPEAIVRVERLFFEKIRARYPGHPWLATARAKEALGRQDAMVWGEPRRVDEWWWMDVEFKEGETLIRGGRVSWLQDGSGYYTISMDYAKEGCGLYCWPSFRALADAQEFVERLMGMSLEQAKLIHGTQWPGVVL
jgi:hypothetical protein